VGTKKRKIEFNYDIEADVLYASLGKPRKGYAIYDENGIVIRADINSDEIIGFTIVNYKKRLKRGLIRNIPNFEWVRLPQY